eukprot:917179_1
MARRGGGKEEAKAGDDSTNNSWDEWEVDNNSPESEGSDTAWVSFGSCSSNEDKRSDFDEASETDEFFDAVERDEVDEEPCSLNFENAELVRNFRCWECEDGTHPKTPPVGILKEIPRLGLLNHPERRINVPVTQEHPLMTTDMLEKEQKRLENLGTSREASLLRAELQASHLLSDMCAFRAANPCCILADFIRWYSPNDWIEEDACWSPRSRSEPKEKKNSFTGNLSVRMKDSRSLWHRLWNKSSPKAAADQEQLFDVDEHGSRALQYLLNLTPTECVDHLASVALNCVMQILCRTDGVLAELPPLLNAVEALQVSLRRTVSSESDGHMTHSVKDSIDIASLDPWMEEFRAFEVLASRATALLALFPERIRLVSDLLDENFSSVKILTAPERKSVASLFAVSSNAENSRYSEEVSSHEHQTFVESKSSKDSNHESPKTTDELRHKSRRSRSLKSTDFEPIQNDITSRDSPEEDVHSRISLGRPTVREFTLMACAPRPQFTSRLVANRLYVRLQDSEFRLASAFGLSEL